MSDEIVKVDAEVVGEQALAKSYGGLTPEKANEVVTAGNYGTLSADERTGIILYLCHKMGLDPLRRPFEFIPDGSGGIKLYANRGAAAQMREKLNINQVPVYMGPMRSFEFLESGELKLGEEIRFGAEGPGVIVTIFKATSKDKETGEVRVSYDLSAMKIDPKFEWFENAIKKMWTQASRRTTIGHSGLGFLDESEASDVGRPMGVGAGQSVAAAPQMRVPPPQKPAQIQAAPVQGVQVVKPKAPSAAPAPPPAPKEEPVEAEVVEAKAAPEEAPEPPPQAAVAPRKPGPTAVPPSVAPRPQPAGPQATATAKVVQNPNYVPQAAAPRPVGVPPKNPLPPQAAPVKVK